MTARSALRPALSTLLVASLLGSALGLAPGASAAPTEGPAASQDPVAEIEAAKPLLDGPRRGTKAIRQLGEGLEVAAAANDLTPSDLKALLKSDETAWLDRAGALHYVDPATAGETAKARAAEPVAALSETFELHSKPGAARTILLDFDGTDVSGTGWNSTYGVASGQHAGWDPSGDGPSFNDDERRRIQQIWAIVAEDFAPFDVDVTTQDPGQEGLLRSSSADTVYGTRVLVSDSDDAHSKICARNCGGVAYLHVFNRVGADAQPAWVFPAALGNDAKNVAEAASHEAGHNLGLSHDGKDQAGYYTGHGAWAPIMGVGYERPVTQWSRGSYTGATNTEDDLSILRGYLGERPDEAPTSPEAAAPLPDGPALIGSTDDVDSYELGTCPSGTRISVSPASAAPNLDVKAVLRDSAGTVREVSNPTTWAASRSSAQGLAAVVTVPESGAGWVLSVEGDGEGSWSTNGYDDYGSLGTYTVDQGDCTASTEDGTPAKPRNATTGTAGADGVTLVWDEPEAGNVGAVSGYEVVRSGSSRISLPADARQFTFTGLAPRTTYDFSVRAVNAAGKGRWATVVTTTEAPPPVPPTAPRDLTGWYDQQAGHIEAWWTPSADTGSDPITGWAIFLDGSYLGELAAAERGVNVTRTGGFAEGEYVVGVAAVSAAGQSSTAEVRVVVTHPTRPANDNFADATVLSGTSGSVDGDNTFATRETHDRTPAGQNAGGYSVWYSWTAQKSGYVSLRTSGGGAGRSTTMSVYDSLPTSAWDLPGVYYTYGAHASGEFRAHAGTTYYFVVDGYTAAGGTGPFTLHWDQTVEVVPGAPLNVRARALENEALVQWDAPAASDRAEAPAGYTVTASPGGQQCTTEQMPFDVTAPAQECSVIGLTNGLAYTFAVTAWNGAGTGPVSASSEPVKPGSDRSAPRVLEASITPDRVSLFGGSATVKLRVTDEGSGVAGAPAVSAEGAGYTSLARVSGDRWDGVYEATLNFPYRSGLGRLPVSVHAVSDAAGNYSAYEGSRLSVIVGAPARPAPPSVSRESRKVTLNWEAPDPDGNLVDAYEIRVVGTGETFSVSEATTYVHRVGLQENDTFAYEIRAHNAGGWSAWSEPSESVTVPRSAPDAPTGVKATPGDGSATVTWEAAEPNGSVVTAYTVRARSGGSVQREVHTDGDATSVEVPGLTNGTAFTFTVTATNARGESVASENTSSVVPFGRPGRPQAPSAVAQDGAAEVSWTAPSANGAAITGYELLIRWNGHLVDTRTIDGGATSIRLAGLDNGIYYSFSLVAINAAGRSVESPVSADVVPSGLVGIPEPPSVVAQDGAVRVSWMPTDAGGSSINQYVVRARSGGQVKATVRVAGGDYSKVVTGLVNGTAYTFTVAAVNARGEGAESAVSAVVTPAGVPLVRTVPTVERGDGSATVRWQEPDANGAALTGFTVRVYPAGGLVRTIQAPGDARSVVVSGLVNGLPHRFSVVAENAVGSSVESPQSLPIAPAGPPPLPQMPYVFFERGLLTVRPPLVPGNGDRLTEIVVRIRVGGQLVRTVTMPMAKEEVVVEGLQIGLEHEVTVAAVNSVGEGPESEAATVFAAGAPLRPSAPTGTGVDRGVLLALSSARDNGSPITGWIVTVRQGSKVHSTLEFTSADGALVPNLTNGLAYTFTVVTQNAEGSSPESTASAPITPKAKVVITKPSKMKAPKVTVKGKQAVVRWSAAKANGGKVSKYLVDIKPNGKVKDIKVSGSKRKATFTKLKRGKYKIRIAAYNQAGRSTFSKWVTVRVR